MKSHPFNIYSILSYQRCSISYYDHFHLLLMVLYLLLLNQSHFIIVIEFHKFNNNQIFHVHLYEPYLLLMLQMVNCIYKVNHPIYSIVFPH